MRIPSITDEPLLRDRENLTPNYKEIYKTDLPLYCPTDEKNEWSAHPRVYLPIEQNGKATCPYCSTVYVLKGSALEDG